MGFVLDETVNYMRGNDSGLIATKGKGGTCKNYYCRFKKLAQPAAQACACGVLLQPYMLVVGK